MDNPLFDMEKACRSLSLSDDEDQIYEYEVDEVEEVCKCEEIPNFLMVGEFLIEGRIPYEIMSDTLSTLWK